MAEAKSIAPRESAASPLVSARVGLRGRCSRRERRRFFRELLSSTVTAVFSTCPRPTDSLPAENFYGAYGVFGGDGPACERNRPDKNKTDNDKNRSHDKQHLDPHGMQEMAFGCVDIQHLNLRQVRDKPFMSVPPLPPSLLAPRPRLLQS